jgi:hypothetical protein
MGRNGHSQERLTFRPLLAMTITKIYQRTMAVLYTFYTILSTAPITSLPTEIAQFPSPQRHSSILYGHVEE